MKRVSHPAGLAAGAGLLLLCCIVVAPVFAQTNFQIYSTPSGAYVLVDNYWSDTTPATIYSVGSGWHTIRVSMDGYQTSSQSQYCDDSSGGEQTCVVNVNLDPVPAALGYLKINPFDAEVYVDGIDYGNGDMSFPLSPGNHVLILKKPGYYDYSETVYITAGDITTRSPGMTPYPAQPEYGSLQIDSNPAGASVFLDNAYKGIEPANGVFYITDLTPGTYTLTLLMPDYQAWTQVVQVQAGIVNDIHATLTPNPAGATPDTTGQIFAYSVPGGVNVYVDNAYRGITPVTIRDLSAGSHTVMFRQTGFQDYSTVASVTGGTIINVPAILSTSPGTGTGPAIAMPLQTTKSPLGGVTAIVALAIVGGLLVLRKTE